jgi:hypothetical protein
MYFQQNFGNGLDDVHPFADSPAVDVLLREAEDILSPNLDAVGRRNATRIWGFFSKFVMVDRFSKSLGVAEVYPGIVVPKKICSLDYLGTGSKVSIFLRTALHLFIKF